MSKPRKVKSFKSDTVPESKMILRMVAVRAETANDDDKSIEVVVASENPVERYDEESGEVVQEILAMDGLVFRGDKRKLPIVDSHDRSTVRNVFGSVRDLQVDGTELVGRATFARDADSQDAYWKLKDGHIDDFSITATPNSVDRIQRGEVGIFRDGEIQGPADIVTSWMPTDASLVAVGADETSTQRSALLRSYSDLKPRVKRMTDEQRAALVGRGMPETVEGTEGALDWMIENMDQPEDEVVKEDDPVEEVIEKEDETETEIEKEDDTEVIEKAVDRALKSDHKRTTEIRALCRSAGIKRELADKLCKPGVSLDQAREKVLERMINKPLGSSVERIEVGSSGIDRMRDAMRDGLLERAHKQTGRRGNPFATQYDQNAKPAEGHQDFNRMSLLRMATEILQRGGVSTGRMTGKDIAMVALGHPGTISRMKHTGIMRADTAWHTTGTFLNLLLDAKNKSLVDGYEEAPFTWEIWARQGNSVADLKQIHRIRYSEYPDLQDIPEGKKYPEGKTSDAKESYAPQKKGSVMTTTWETIVNDDMDAISRVPQMQGTAARRKQNKSVYAELTDNAKMADDIALFHASHGNLAGSGGAISETTLNAAYTAMMTQTNLGGEIIGVVPKYLIVPAAIAATADQLVTSQTPPSVGGSAVGTSGTNNIYGPNGNRRLEVVVEPQLDANSTTAWYLAAENNQVDTVELTFLEGEESPVLESEWDFDTDVIKDKIRQTYGTKAIDHRGLYKNPGA